VTENRLEDRSSQSVRTYEEIRGAFDSKGGRRPQSPVSTTVNGDCSTSHNYASASDCMSLDGGDRNGDRSTSRHLDDGWSRLKTEVNYEVVSALSCLHFIRSLAKLSLVTLTLTEPTIRMYNVVY